MHPRSQQARLSPSLIARNCLSAALAFCLLGAPLSVFAADTDEAALARAETILFGEQVQGGELSDRLGRVEKRIFGRRKKGTDEERIERITSTLLIDRKKLKITKTAGELKNNAEQPPEPLADKQAESIPEMKAESVAEMQTAPAVQSAQELPVQAPEAAVQPAAEAEKAKDSAVQKTQAPVAEKPIAAKGKGKKSAKSARKTAGKSDHNQPVAGKQPEIILKQETAALDSRKDEKRSSALDTPVSHTSSSPHRISRGGAAKVHEVANLLKDGIEAHRRGEDVKAEQLFKKVVLLEPRNPDGYFNLGALAEKKKDLAGALMSYRAALNLSPNDRELKEAVDSVEGMLGVEASAHHQVAGGRSAGGEAENAEPKSAEQRSAEIREFYAKDSAARERAIMESSDRFASPQGSYGFGHNRRTGHNTHSGPAPAPNFYRARAKTTREIQEEAAPYADVNEPNASVMSVSPPPTPVANTAQPQPFQLQTQRSQAAMQANQQKRPSTAGTATRAILGVALSVGTRYALRSSGLHCPVCRIGGGGGALRGLLRF
ncbi:MAG: hypothetical protein IT342_26585 [Candidatus Melainabacteria bacterium]|nr:hypothetical protein [Candidatus Melainabacteria bacterium]